jgi:hypothetical protein
MIRKLFLLVFATAIIAGCGNNGNKNVKSGPEVTDNGTKVEFASLIENPGSYIGKTISVEGKVVHVCMQSGKKLFITGENPDIMLYVQSGENMPKFPMELLGSEIVVEGTITNAVASAMGESEGMGMHMGEGAAGMVSSDTCETSKTMAAQTVLADLMMIYNKHEVIK